METNKDYVYHVTVEEWEKIIKQNNIDYDLIKNGDDPKEWYYQVYYYDTLKYLIAIVKYRYIVNYKKSIKKECEENKMKEVAKLLGVEMGVPFRIKTDKYNPFIFDNDGLVDCEDCYRNDLLISLLNGTYEIEQPILDEVERCYLEGVLRPFKDEVDYIEKQPYSGTEEEFIHFYIRNDYNFIFPNFKKQTMYKGMELYKPYTLGELGLFQD